MKETVALKYCIPKLEFTVKPKNAQIFTVQYAQYYHATHPDVVYWQNLGNVTVQPDGSIAWGTLEFNDLQPFTEYVVRFSANGESYDFLFKTGKNISLDDSPYYDKVLFPGQIYDWYQVGLDAIGVPNRSECLGYYKLNSKKSLTGPVSELENWGSMLMYKYNNLAGKWDPSLDDGNWGTYKDKDGYSFVGSHVDNKDKNEIYCLGLPTMKYDEDKKSFVYWHAYWNSAGGGGMLASDFMAKAHSKYNKVGFAFCIDKEVDEEVTICGYDSATYTHYPILQPRTYWKLKFTPDGRIKTIYNDGISEQAVESDPIFEKDKWYFILPDTEGEGHIIYKMDPINEDYSQKYTILTAPSIARNLYTSPALSDHITNGDTGLTTYISWAVPFLFGDENTSGVYIANFAIDMDFSQKTITGDISIIQKLMNPGAYGPRVRLSGTTSKGAWEYKLDGKFNTVVDSEKLSVLIDPDIFEKVPQIQGIKYNEIGKVIATIIINDTPYYQKVFNGFAYNDSKLGYINVGGLIDSNTYTVDSYDLIFKEEGTDTVLEKLKEHFFTKHGTWGGYNGGVNGHNIYFNSEGNLILECHGDYYKGTLKGVCKESKVTPYTGYGSDVDYDNNLWDGRSNKMTARTGTALVSNKYYQYGRVDITMKIPVGTWGVCPAIWFFHYIEVGDTDYRYELPPYNERVIQGNGEDGFYRVVNNEIDIELPSHLTNGVLPSFNDLGMAYFDRDIIDNQLRIGVNSGLEKGLWRLNKPDMPNMDLSWVKESNTYKTRVEPTFANCKFNNWVGELNAGDGWCLPQDDMSAEEYYKATEEYSSFLTKLSDNSNGYADGQFHTWSIVWLPDRTVLLVDDVIMRENRGFVPFNQMKLTIAMWFPTMPINKNGGVTDRDGVHGVKGGVISYLDDTPNTSIGTWAGTQADFEVCHLEISRIKYEKYNAGDAIIINGKTTHIESNPTYLGESFPESGLRMFTD